MNKKITKGLAAGLIMLTSMGVAFGAGTQYEIKATMDSGITVKYKGEVQELKDVNGVSKDPILYNGTTYIPVRSVGEIFGINVDWDQETKSVLLEDKISVSLEEDSLETIMEAVYSGVGDKIPMMIANTVITEENSAYYLGLESLTEDTEALASESMITSVAHSVCLLRAAEGTDIEALKNEIKEKVNPRKWICVGVEREEVIVDNIGNLIIMIIDKSAPEKYQESFLKLNNEQ